MKGVIVLLAALVLSNYANAQVMGYVRNERQQAIAYASVHLITHADSSIKSTIISDSTGFFLFPEALPDSFFLRITGIGYKPVSSNIFSINRESQGKDTMTIFLEDDNSLGEVVIKSVKPLYEQKNGALIINVESSLFTKGSTVLELLERSPGIVIDRRNNGISLNGKNNVLIMLNRKALTMPVEQVSSFLAGMSANDIERLELFSTPPPGFDAEGIGGVINIVLKKNKRQGTTGGMSVTGGYGRGEKAAADLNIAHNTGKLSLYGSFHYLRDRGYSQMFIDSYQDMPVYGGELQVYVWDTTRYLNNNYDAVSRIEISPDSSITAGYNIAFNRSIRNAYNNSRSDFTLQPDSLLFFKGRIDGSTYWQSIIHTAYLEKRISQKAKLSVDADYMRFTNDNPSKVKNSFVLENGTPVDTSNSLFAPNQRGYASTAIQVGVAKIDYSQRLNKSILLETGAKATHTRTSSRAGIESLINGHWVTRNATVNNVKMKETLLAAYFSGTIQFNPVYQLVAGLRYEYATTLMNDPVDNREIVNRQQAALFPTAVLTAKTGEQSSLNLAYNKRIGRPSYTDLVSFIRYSDPTAVYTGNTFLKPTISNTVTVGYNLKKYNFSLSFSHERNAIIRYQITESLQRDLLVISPQNMPGQHTLSLQAILPFRISSWWNMQYSFNGGLKHFRLEHTKQPVEKNYLYYSANFSQAFSLPKSFSAEISGWYNSRVYNGSIKVGSMGAVNVGLKKEMSKNQGSFQLTVTDIFRTMNINTYYGTITAEAFNIKNHVDIDLESAKFPIFRLSFTRSFGKSVSEKRKEKISTEEKDRVIQN